MTAFSVAAILISVKTSGHKYKYFTCYIRIQIFIGT